MVERDFHPKTGRMTSKISPEDKARIKGHLPFYSVDTQEEVDGIIQLALEQGEFVQRPDGAIFESTLLYDQSLDNLYLAGDRLAALHEQWKERNGCAT